MKYSQIKYLALIILVLLAGCMSSADVSNEPPLGYPTVDAGEDQTVEVGATVTLAGSGSDSNGTIASYLWEQRSGTEVSLDNPGTDTATFTAPDTAGVLSFRLTVRDNEGNAWDDTMSVTVEETLAQNAPFTAPIPSLPYPLLDPYNESSIGAYSLVAVDYDKQPPSLIKEDGNRYILPEEESINVFDYHLIELSLEEGNKEISVFIHGQSDVNQKIEWRGVLVAVLNQHTQPFIEAHSEMFKEGKQSVDLAQWELELGDTIKRLYLIVAALPVQSQLIVEHYTYALDIAGAKPIGGESAL